MRRLPLTLLAAAALAGSAAASARADAGAADEIIVLRAGGLTRGERADAGVRAEHRLPLAGAELVSADGARATALAALRADPDVVWAEPNVARRALADPLTGHLWGLENTGPLSWLHGTLDADIDAPEAWTVTRGAGVTVAVVDTGADLGHPDLAGRLVPGYDFVGDDSDPSDEHGHGTHVTGTIAAGENGVGVVGVAPEARVMPLRVLDASGSGYLVDVVAAFDHAGTSGVRVVNASLGSPQSSLYERAAIRAHPNTLFVAAAGNENANNDVTAMYPCAYDEPNVICVGASDPNDARASFSNFGAATVDLFAPGESIVSTIPGGHAAMDGTSMAAPHAAGAAALTLGAQPSHSTAQVRAALLGGVDRPAGLAGLSVTGGRLNAAATLGVVAPPQAAPPAVAPLARAATAPAPAVAPLAPAVAADISRLQLRLRPRAHAAKLSFSLAAEADVALRVERRRCADGRCRWRLAGTRSRHLPAGALGWLVGPRQRTPLARGTWRVKLTTAAGTAQRRFWMR